MRTDAQRRDDDCSLTLLVRDDSERIRYKSRWYEGPADLGGEPLFQIRDDARDVLKAEIAADLGDLVRPIGDISRYASKIDRKDHELPVLLAAIGQYRPFIGAVFRRNRSRRDQNNGRMAGADPLVDGRAPIAARLERAAIEQDLVVVRVQRVGDRHQGRALRRAVLGAMAEEQARFRHYPRSRTERRCARARRKCGRMRNDATMTAPSRFLCAMIASESVTNQGGMRGQPERAMRMSRSSPASRQCR